MSEDLAALTNVYARLLKGQYNAAEAALDFGELDEFLAKATITMAQSIQHDAAAGRVTLMFTVTTNQAEPVVELDHEAPTE